MRLFTAPLRAAFFSAAVLGLAAIAAPSAHAAFLIDPTGGTALSGFTDIFGGTGADPDDGTLLRGLGGSFSLYGTNLTSIYVNVNGFLSNTEGSALAADSTVANLANSNASSVIAAYYDDLYLDTSVGNTIIEKFVAGSYYSVTYTVNGLNDFTPTATAKFQTVLFTGNTTVNGVSFLAGDIVYSYGTPTNTVTGSNFSVGVARNATTATNAFNATGGQFATNASFFSNFNLATQGLLFRPTGGGTSYAQTLTPLSITPLAAPEPGTLVLVGTGALPLLGVVARRRRKTA